MKSIPKELLKEVSEDATKLLEDIEQLHVCKHAEDVASAKREGARLLAIARVDNDEDGDGFRYLIGLRRGVEVTPHLSCFFQRR